MFGGRSYNEVTTRPPSWGSRKRSWEPRGEDTFHRRLVDCLGEADKSWTTHPQMIGEGVYRIGSPRPLGGGWFERLRLVWKGGISRDLASFVMKHISRKRLYHSSVFLKSLLRIADCTLESWAVRPWDHKNQLFAGPVKKRRENKEMHFVLCVHLTLMCVTSIRLDCEWWIIDLKKIWLLCHCKSRKCSGKSSPTRTRTGW